MLGFAGAFRLNATGPLDGLAAHLQAHGLYPRPDTNFPGYRRFYLDDCFGNRLEFLSPLNDAQTQADPVMPVM